MLSGFLAGAWEWTCFFVISGYVVTLQLLKSADTPSDEPFLLDFFARRAKRLVPILIVVIVSTSAFLVLVAPLWVKKVSEMLATGFAGLFGWANNFELLDTETNYWTLDKDDLRQGNPFFHLWSLGVEEQFYMILGLLLFFTGLGIRWHGAESASENSDRIKRTLFPVILVSIAMSLCLSAYLCQKSLATSYGFYLVFARFWELASGVALALRSDKIAAGLESSKSWLRILDVLAALLLTTSLACIDENGFLWQPKGEEPRFPWPYALFPVLGSLCYLAAGLRGERWNLNGLLSSKSVVYVGDLSYSIYLWHVPVLALMTWLSASAAKSSPMNLIFAVSLVSLLSVTGFHFVEQPFRKVRLSWWRAISIAVLAVIAAASLQCLMQSYRSTARLAELNSSMPSELPGLYARNGCSCTAVHGSQFHLAPKTKASTASNAPACLYNLPFQSAMGDILRPQLPCGFFVPKNQKKLPQSKCFVKLPSTIQRKGPAVWVIGDSHAGCLMPAINAATSRQVYGRAWSEGRIPVIEAYFHEMVQADDVVIFAHALEHDSSSQYRATNYLDDVERLYNITSRNGAKLVLLSDTPLLSKTPQACLLDREACKKTSKAGMMEVRSETTAVATSMAQTHEDVYFFDYFSLLCNAETCDQFVPGTSTLAYTDTHHLTAAGSLYVAPFLCSWFRKNGLAD